MNRPDISQFLAHFTSNKFPKGFKDPDNPTNSYKYVSPEKRLISILEGRKIIASQMPWIGKHNAVCFTECPWASLITHTQQYSSYGIGFTKNFIFNKGGGPVYYVRADVFNSQQWDDAVLPYVTPFWPLYAPKGIKPLGTPRAGQTIFCDYSHEREWRVTHDLEFEYEDVQFVVLPDYMAMARFPKELKDAIGREKFLLIDNYKMIEELWPVHKL